MEDIIANACTLQPNCASLLHSIPHSPHPVFLLVQLPLLLRVASCGQTIRTLFPRRPMHVCSDRNLVFIAPMPTAEFVRFRRELAPDWTNVTDVLK